MIIWKSFINVEIVTWIICIVLLIKIIERVLIARIKDTSILTWFRWYLIWIKRYTIAHKKVRQMKIAIISAKAERIFNTESIVMKIEDEFHIILFSIEKNYWMTD